MVNNQASSSDIVDNSLQGDKPCAGMDCNNAGIYRLSIVYINKIGYFCLNCKKELENYGLVLSSESIKNNVLGGDKK